MKLLFNYNVACFLCKNAKVSFFSRKYVHVYHKYLAEVFKEIINHVIIQEVSGYIHIRTAVNVTALRHQKPLPDGPVHCTCVILPAAAAFFADMAAKQSSAAINQDT